MVLLFHALIYQSRQYEATSDSIELLKQDDTCSDETLQQLDNSFDFLTDQLNGYCEAPAESNCQMEMAISTCIVERAWYDPDSCR